MGRSIAVNRVFT
jgi:hypothetical protein